MRHRKKRLKLGTSISHRKAILSNLATELIRCGTIQTTYAKAKVLSSFTERLVTEAKKQTLAAYRNVISSLKDEDVANKFFTETIVKKFMEKNGGYTRILRLPPRHGDNSPMAIINLETKQTSSHTDLQKPEIVVDNK